MRRTQGRGSEVHGGGLACSSTPPPTGGWQLRGATSRPRPRSCVAALGSSLLGGSELAVWGTGLCPCVPTLVLSAASLGQAEC